MMDRHDRLVAQPPDWVDLIDRFAAAMPRGASLTVWPYELYRPHAREILSLVTGKDFATIPEIRDPISTRTPGAEALDPGLSGSERLRRTRELHEATEQADEKFAPFTPDESERMHAAYQRQVEHLAARPGITMLREAELSDMAARQSVSHPSGRWRD